MKYFSFHLLSLLFIALMAACNPGEEAIPAYIHISDISLSTTYSKEGSASEKITDVWVYLGDEIQGVYELPATFPILANGPTELLLYGGININGIAATRAGYPFYRPDTVLFDLKEAKIDTVHLAVVGYRSTVNLALHEDFENGNTFGNIERISGGDPNIFEGGAAGRLMAENATGGILNTTMSKTFYVEPLVSDYYMELDYKSNYPFTVGIKAYQNGASASIAKLTINEQENWNKIYIDLTQEVNRLQGDDYELFFRVNTENAADPADIKIYVDNIKFVRFKSP